MSWKIAGLPWEPELRTGTFWTRAVRGIAAGTCRTRWGSIIPCLQHLAQLRFNPFLHQRVIKHQELQHLLPARWTVGKYIYICTCVYIYIYIWNKVAGWIVARVFKQSVNAALTTCTPVERSFSSRECVSHCGHPSKCPSHLCWYQDAAELLFL